MTYSFSSTAKNFISDFYIIVSESETKEITFFEDLKSCYENNADFYLLNYDPNISLENKQKLLFEFVKAVTAKRKLIDSKLHLVANVNLDDYYNNFREKDEFYLNSINSIQIFTDPIYSPCQFTSKR
ncbi:MAG: hypothetical protein EOP00_18245 [Pedobacter sp.]|nr:MAG: hypothetical protein EOP00_18245 [Pedobacter sp.]